MIDSKDILTLLSIPSDNVSNASIISDANNITYVDIELQDIRDSCPFCFSKKIGIKDYYQKKIKNNVIRRHNLIVNIRMRRYVCKKCKKTFKQRFFMCDEKGSISNKTKELVRYMLLDRVSMEYISKELSISKQTVINILDDMPDSLRLPLPSVICIDEFHFSNANHKAGKYPCVLSNPFTSDIIDIVESRQKPYLFDYFAKISLLEREKVKYFISDMNETYRMVHHSFFIKSIHIVDHFHIIKLFTEAIQVTRTRIMKTYDITSKEYKYLKKNWKLFLMNRFNLKDKKYTNNKTGITYNILDSIDMVLKAYPDLFELYWTKDEFVNAMLKLREIDEVKSNMDFLLINFQNHLIRN